MNVKLIDEATAANDVPSAATDGFAISRYGHAAGEAAVSRNVPTNGQCGLVVASTAGSGTMTVTLKFWVYHKASAVWSPYGSHATAASRGLLNEANAIDEIAADTISHTELINGLTNWDRVYLEITAIGGTATAVSAWLVGR